MAENEIDNSKTPGVDPYKTMCVVTHDGVEVGRVPATARNAPDYIDALARQYGGVSIKYVHDENAGALAHLLDNPGT